MLWYTGMDEPKKLLHIHFGYFSFTNDIGLRDIQCRETICEYFNEE